MAHSNISIFIPHLGCPNCCSYCNQKIISGTITPAVADDVTEILTNACQKLSDPLNTEIAFFGGTFTALEKTYMISLLEAAQPFIEKYNLIGIRISTRPDCINRDILHLLKRYHVTAIELGVPSMCDYVLFANKRGHSPDDVRNSSWLIKEYGFELGLQMMTGLFQSAPEDELYTALEIIALGPSSVRIYPIVILKGTRLAELYQSGLYKLIDFESMISVCADLLELFNSNNIKVIRLGLQASKDIESQMIAGYYHPAFRELCEGNIFRRIIEKKTIGTGNFFGYVNPRDLSKAIGHKKSNIKYFENMGKHIDFFVDENLSLNQIIVKKTVDKCI